MTWELPPFLSLKRNFLLGSCEHYNSSRGEVPQTPFLLHHCWERNGSCCLLETAELAATITHVNTHVHSSSFLTFSPNVFSSFYWSLVFLKLSLQCQHSLLLFCLPPSTTSLHAKCIRPCPFHLSSCNSEIPVIWACSACLCPSWPLLRFYVRIPLWTQCWNTAHQQPSSPSAWHSEVFSCSLG